MSVVSVIIPTQNRSRFLERLLEPFHAFASQVEVIVVDDGSSDEQSVQNAEITGTIADSTYQRLVPSRGAAAARNYGLALSTCEYVWFIDDDDQVTDQTIEDVLKAITQIYANAYLLPKDVMYGNLRIGHINPIEREHTFEAYRRFGHVVNTSCAIFRRKVLKEIGGWDEELLAGQDTDLFLRFSKISEFECIATEPVLVHTAHSSRITRRVYRQQIGKLQFLRKHWSWLSNGRRLRYILSFLFCAPFFLPLRLKYKVLTSKRARFIEAGN